MKNLKRSFIPSKTRTKSLSLFSKPFLRGSLLKPFSLALAFAFLFSFFLDIRVEGIKTSPSSKKASSTLNLDKPLTSSFALLKTPFEQASKIKSSLESLTITLSTLAKADDTGGAKTTVAKTGGVVAKALSVKKITTETEGSSASGDSNNNIPENPVLDQCIARPTISLSGCETQGNDETTRARCDKSYAYNNACKSFLAENSKKGDACRDTYKEYYNDAKEDRKSTIEERKDLLDEQQKIEDDSERSDERIRNLEKKITKAGQDYQKVLTDLQNELNESANADEEAMAAAMKVISEKTNQLTANTTTARSEVSSQSQELLTGAYLACKEKAQEVATKIYGNSLALAKASNEGRLSSKPKSIAQIKKEVTDSYNVCLETAKTSATNDYQKKVNALETERQGLLSDIQSLQQEVNNFANKKNRRDQDIKTRQQNAFTNYQTATNEAQVDIAKEQQLKTQKSMQRMFSYQKMLSDNTSQRVVDLAESKLNAFNDCCEEAGSSENASRDDDRGAKKYVLRISGQQGVPQSFCNKKPREKGSRTRTRK